MVNIPRFRLITQRFKAMGSPCEIKLYAASLSRGQHVARRMVDELERLEAKYSRYRANSFLSKINRCAAEGGSLEVDHETSGLLDYVASCYQESDGLFDVTSGKLRAVWDFASGRIPSPSEVEAVLEHVGWEKLFWQHPFLKFPNPGLEVDLGGAVKEYAADRLVVLAKEAGLNHGLINLGGDIAILGPHPDGTPWEVGIRDPRAQGQVIENLALKGGALATSGDYERCLIREGVRYSHILNPKSGWPVSGLTSVSVVAPLAVVAGSLSTIAMLKGEAGVAWLQSIGASALWVDQMGNVGRSFG